MVQPAGGDKVSVHFDLLTLAHKWHDRMRPEVAAANFAKEKVFYRHFANQKAKKKTNLAHDYNKELNPFVWIMAILRVKTIYLELCESKGI